MSRLQSATGVRVTLSMVAEQRVTGKKTSQCSAGCHIDLLCPFSPGRVAEIANVQRRDSLLFRILSRILLSRQPACIGDYVDRRREAASSGLWLPYTARQRKEWEEAVAGEREGLWGHR